MKTKDRQFWTNLNGSEEWINTLKQYIKSEKLMKFEDFEKSKQL